MRMIFNGLAILSVVLAARPAAVGGSDSLRWRFSFPGAPVREGFTPVDGETQYDPKSGYGFERGTGMKLPAFFFSVRLPEGNYDVAVTLGNPMSESITTVKAELRRLMLENIHTRANEFAERRFTVNIRQPRISTGGQVILKGVRESEKERWAWDDKLTLEFDGEQPGVREIEISPATGPTLFILGDSTSCDQCDEPWNSWGQMITRFFKPGLAVSNQGESGETLAGALHARRLEKVLDSMKPGDYLFIQFGHNDQKDKTPGAGPFTTYKARLKMFVDKAREKGGLPVLITPVNRKAPRSLDEYAAAVREAASEEKVPLIDLNQLSATLYRAIGEANLSHAFVDGTHHTDYGSYEIAKCVISGIQETKLDLARFIVDDFKTFDPAHPDAIEEFRVPVSPNFSTSKPAGS